MEWAQRYDPLGFFPASATLAALPIVALFVSLAFLRLRVSTAALFTLGLTLGAAILPWGVPSPKVFAAAFYGLLFGLFPIGYIFTATILLFNSVKESGYFDIIRTSLENLTPDRRLQALLIGFGLTAFLDSTGGFGSSVAVAAAVLAGLGFSPLDAATVCLIANAASSGFGAIGVPVIVLSGITGLPLEDLSAMMGRQIPITAFLIPFMILQTLVRGREFRQVLPHAALCALSFSLPAWAISNYIGPHLASLIPSLLSMASVYFSIKILALKKPYRFPGDRPFEAPASTFSPGERFKAWAPFGLLTLIIFLWNAGPVKSFLQRFSLNWEVPGLHRLILKEGAQPMEAIFNFDYLSSAGTAALLSAIISAALLGLNLRGFIRVVRLTFAQLKSALIAMGALFALSFVINYSGMATSLGLAFAASGRAFPFLSPLLAWLGAFITGSNTASNAIFGNLQVAAARKLAISPLLAASANGSGSVAAKMIAPQVVAMACAATKISGQEGTVFIKNIIRSLAIVLIVGLITYLQANYATWMVP